MTSTEKLGQSYYNFSEKNKKITDMVEWLLCLYFDLVALYLNTIRSIKRRNGVNTLRALGMYSGFQRNDFTLHFTLTMKFL